MVIGSITTVIQVINMLTPYGLILYFIFWSDLMMTTRNLDFCICRLVLNGNIRIAQNNHPPLYSWQSTQTRKLFVVNVPTSPHSSHFSIFIMKHKNLLHFINIFLPHFIKKLKLLLPPRFWGTIYKERLTWWSKGVIIYIYIYIYIQIILPVIKCVLVLGPIRNV
jgi:hypothetical protein